ncbi:MAG: phosphotransferase [Bacteroidales bacterium]|nr:phosphotransferase [Bacteroidales bacterium]
METLRQLFADWAGEPCSECLIIGANGSNRQYYRLLGPTKTAIGTVANDLRENEAFFAFSAHFRDKGIPVPELYAIHPDRRHYLQQDLGDLTLYGLLHEKKQQGGGFDAQMLALYRQALTDLDAIQRAGRDLDFSIAYPRPAFDRRAILWDLNYFKYFFLKLNHIDFDEEFLENDFQHLADLLLQADCSYFLYRDFNPRNIMVVENSKLKIENSLPHSDNFQLSTLNFQLYYIDYQGGRSGAAQYDVASLLYSAKSDLPEAIRQELLRHYASIHGDPHFLDHFWLYALIRILQTLGAYGYRGLYERKPYFIQSIPLALNNLRHLIQEHPLPTDLPELGRVLSDKNLVFSETIQIGSSPLNANHLTLNTENTLTVTVGSFSYKLGLPSDNSGNGGGHIFDCRALPNPGRYPEYKTYTGKDRPVIEFLQKELAVRQFLDHVQAIAAQSIDKYLERHFTHLSIYFGCTGGQHRSVYCAEQLAAWIRDTYPSVNVVVAHRENP